VTGERYADALAAAQDFQERSGAMSVHAFDQRETLLGQGTLALELAEQAGDLDTVLVPVGGGGLIAGIASYFAGTVRVIGVEPDGAPTLTYARAEGQPADAPAGSVAADALAPRRVGELVFPITQSFVEDVVLVDDASILAAQQALWQALRIAAEPAASVGIAALLTGTYEPAPGEQVAVVISGANVAPSQLGWMAPVYVAETETARLWAFDIEAPGVFKKHGFPSPHGGRLVAGLAGFQRFDSIAVTASGNVCVATLTTGFITVITPGGDVVKQVKVPDVYPTNICFGGADLRTAYITLSDQGQLGVMQWDEPGLKLNYAV